MADENVRIELGDIRVHTGLKLSVQADSDTPAPAIEVKEAVDDPTFGAIHKQIEAAIREKIPKIMLKEYAIYLPR